MIKRTTLLTLVFILLVVSQSFAAHKHKKISDTTNDQVPDSIKAEIFNYFHERDSIEKSIKYQYGSIPLSNGIGTINIPPGFKFIDKPQAEHVLYDIWKNRRTDNTTLGLILPENSGIFSDSSFVFNVEYEDIGYVKDDDADKIDYNELLKNMQKEDADDNPERVKEGYKPITLIGWATPPFYDKERKILHWAKELKFGDDSINTLNYNVRILGRKGVLVLNAIASMDQLKNVQTNLPKVMDIVSFTDGNKYKDFDPSIDKIAAWTIGGLVAGKILAKVGFFAILAKFGKVIILGIMGAFAALRKKVSGWFKKKKDDDNDNMPPNVIRPRDNW